MSTNRRKEGFRRDDHRLSRESSSTSLNRSETLLTNDRSRRGSIQNAKPGIERHRNTSSIEPDYKIKGGAEAAEVGEDS